MGDLEQLAEAVMAGHTDTDVDHWRGCVSTANRIAKAANLTPPVTGVEGAGGPFKAPAAARGVLLEQLGARWPCSDGRARTVPEMVTHVLGVVSALPAGTIPSSGTTTPAPSSPPSSGSGGSGIGNWGRLPVLTARAATDERSSFQSAVPTFGADGMVVSLLPRGDRAGTPNPTKGGDTQRCEILLAGWAGLSGAQYLRYDFTLADGFPVDTDDWQAIAQLKNSGTGSPPLELMVGRGEVYLQWHDAGGRETGREVLGKATTGVRHAVVLRVGFSNLKSVVGGWYDGREAFSAEHGPTMYPGQSVYGKLGLYRSNRIGKAATVVHHGVARGGTLAAVTG